MTKLASISNRRERKLAKAEQEIYNLLPFLLSYIVFPREYFATREPRASTLLFHKKAKRRERSKWRRDQMEFFRHAGRLFEDGDPAGPITPVNTPPPQPAGSNYRAVSWHRFNFPAKYTGDVYLANCLFQTCIAFTVKRYKNTVEFRLNTVGNSKS